MSFLKRLFGIDQLVETAVEVVAPAALPREAKVDFHIGRFTRALEQFDPAKGEARRAELQQNLDYWLAVKAAAAIRPE